ncbi:hypothetical protein L207DRAFT_521421, partial [Hyaloscypha variabilis F]
APIPVRHAISPLTASPRTNIITLSELLLLILFLVLTIVRFLRGTPSVPSVPSGPSVPYSLRPLAPALLVKPPASLDSFRILAKLGVVNESLLLPSPLPSSPSPSSPSPSSPTSTSPRPYVPPHFHHYLAIGTCHLNEKGELYLRPKPKHGTQREQVKRRTDGTEWDKDVSKRPSNPVVFRTSFSTRF